MNFPDSTDTSPPKLGPTPKPSNTALKARVEALKARVEALEGKLDEAVWYIGELQFALKTIIAQAAMQKLGPMVQQQMQQEIMDRLNAGGIGAGLTGVPTQR